MSNFRTKPGRARNIYLKARRVFGRKVIKSFNYATNTIFIHIPKAAGRSISSSLYDDVRPGHFYCSDYIDEDIELWERSFKFAFVRHPEERLKSAYYFLIGGGITKKDNLFGCKLSEETVSFDDFVINWLSEDKIYSWIHFVPQHNFICIENKIAIDYIGRYENLELDFKYISSMVKTAGKGLQSINVTPKNKFSCGDKSKRIITELYKKDYELFGYK